jgi:molybdopterin molybdotransferase
MREVDSGASRISVEVEEARSIILGSIRPLGAERVPLREALGRVLQEEVTAARPIPPLDNSAMDGFALRAADVAALPASLKVVEEIPAGRRSGRRLGPGEAARILTGAPIPEGADAVVMQEETEREGDALRVRCAVQRGDHIRRAGSDVVPGQVVARQGTLLRPAHLGMLAALGRASVRVTCRPRVAILATGDEIVEPDQLGDDGRIASSNSYTLQAAVAGAGGEPVYLGIAPDRPEVIREYLERASGCDAVISTGGVSVGDRDYIKGVLAQLGGHMRLWRVRMKPGAPLAFAVLGDTPVFGLPGNPVSSLVSFEQFVRPALLRMQRHTRIYRPVEPAVLAEPYRKPPGRMHFARVTLEERGGRLRAHLTGDQSSGVLFSLVAADGLAIIAAQVTDLPAGSEVPVQLLHREDLREEPGF